MAASDKGSEPRWKVAHEELASDPHWVAAFDKSRLRELGNRLSEEFSIEDRAGVLGLITYMLNIWFGGAVVSTTPYDPDSLDEIADASQHLWDLATNDLNHAHMRWMFGSDRVRGLLERLHTEMAELRAFAEAAHVKPRRGRGDRKRSDLYYMVEQSTGHWAMLTGRKATNDWLDGQPVSEFARFCAAVVEYVDPESVPKLQTVIRRVITRRNKDGREPDTYYTELPDNTDEKD
jgi:hypothetical protein